MTRRTRWATLAATTLVLTACGGGSDDASINTEASSTAADTSVADAEPTEAPADDETATDTEPDATTADTDAASSEASTGGFEPGPIQFRAVNLLDQPVDLYVRTSGLVEAFQVRDDLAPGEVSEFASPPDGGIFLVTTSDATDPTCVTTCDDFIAEFFTFPDEGPTRTVVLYGDEFDPTLSLELWDEPTPDASDSNNRVIDADPTLSIAVITGIAVKDADFGLRVSAEGIDGCLQPIGQEGILVGGQTVGIGLEQPGTQLTIHDQPDQDCSAPPVGGPFTIEGGPGSRTHVILSGSPGSLDAILLEVEGSVPDAAPSSGADDALARTLMTAEVESEFGLPTDQAACFADLLVDRIGADTLLDGETLVDLDGLPQEISDIAGAALFDSVEECGVDPASIGA